MRLHLRSFLAVLFIPVLASSALAQASDSTARVDGATVSGVVHDSISGQPLSGAMVQLIAADDPTLLVRTGMADGFGYFAWDSVPEGRYLLGFMHPMIDSLGLALPYREVRVTGGTAVRADLAIPGARQLGVALCGPRFATDSTAVLVGFVHHAQSRAPAIGAVVTGEWLEIALRPGGVFQQVARVDATADENGWFALCGVPRDVVIGVRAGLDADSTALIEVNVPAHGFMRRVLFVGAAQTIASTEVAVPDSDDSLAVEPRLVQVGSGRLTGTVVRAVDGSPLPDAQVRIQDGPRVKVNADGEWTLVDVPAGTRMLEVRSLGYYPERRVVNVVADAAPVHVALSTFSAVMDTVKVTATRLFDRDSDGFQRRRRTGAGRYLDADDIAKHRPMETSHVFRMVPGLRLANEGGFGEVIQMRSNYAGMCHPTIYVDGLQMWDAEASGVDMWVRPAEIKGIEIYSAASTPGRYQSRKGCGTILIWTR